MFNTRTVIIIIIIAVATDSIIITDSLINADFIRL